MTPQRLSRSGIEQREDDQTHSTGKYTGSDDASSSEETLFRNEEEEIDTVWFPKTQTFFILVH